MDIAVIESPENNKDIIRRYYGLHKVLVRLVCPPLARFKTGILISCHVAIMDIWLYSVD